MLCTFDYGGRTLTVDTQDLNLTLIWSKLGLNSVERRSAEKIIKLLSSGEGDIADYKPRKTLEKAVSEVTIQRARTLSIPVRSVGAKKDIVDKLIDEGILQRKERQEQPVYGLNVKKLYELENGYFL